MTQEQQEINDEAEYYQWQLESQWMEQKQQELSMEEVCQKKQ